MEYLLIKWVHILSATVLFGTGIGSAFYLLTAVGGRRPAIVAHVAGWVVRADWMFTATTAVVQPATGWGMMHLAGLSVDARWIAWSIALYALAMACWLPVVWLQIQMRDLALQADAAGSALPAAFWRCFWWWFGLGIPALVGFLAIFWLMVAKPTTA